MLSLPLARPPRHPPTGTHLSLSLPGQAASHLLPGRRLHCFQFLSLRQDQLPPSRLSRGDFTATPKSLRTRPSSKLADPRTFPDLNLEQSAYSFCFRAPSGPVFNRACLLVAPHPQAHFPPKQPKVHLTYSPALATTKVNPLEPNPDISTTLSIKTNQEASSLPQEGPRVAAAGARAPR